MISPSVVDLKTALRRLTPIAELPIAWDASGYTSASFNEEVQGEAFDGWSGDLADEEEAAVIARLLYVKPGDALFDIACGYGRHALLLAGEYGLRVTGIDISPGLIATARRMAAKKGLNITYELMHARDLDQREAFDHAIIAHNTFSVFSPEDAPAILRRIHAALKPGGRLFLDLDNKPSYCRYGTCYRNWYLGERGLVLQEVYFHEDSSVEVMRDLSLTEGLDEMTEFVCFKRIYSLEDIRALLATCGFGIKAVYGNWDLTRWSENSPKILMTAGKRVES